MRPGTGRQGRDVAAHEVAAGQLAELHPKERPGGLVELPGIEVFLHDLGRRAGGEGVAFRRQVRPGDRLGDGRHLRGDKVQAFQAPGHRRTHLGGGADGDHGRRPVHGIHRQHVAHPIHYGDGARQIPRLGLRRHLPNHLLNLGVRQPRGRIGALPIATHGDGRRGTARGDGAAPLLRRNFRTLTATTATAGGEGKG